MRVKLYFDDKVKFVFLDKETVDEVRGYATKFVLSQEPSVTAPNFSGYIEVLNTSGATISKDEQVRNLLKDEYVFVRLYDVFCPSGDVPVSSWYWKDEYSTWKPYQPPDNKAIEEAYQSNSGPVKILNGTYSCDPVSLKQTRLSTSVQRKMMRGTWFWTHESNGLVPYEPTVAAELEREYQKYKTGKASTFPVGNGRTVNFASMKQTTYGSNTDRQVVRGANGKTKRYYSKPRKPYIAPNPQGIDYFSSFNDLPVLAEFLHLPDLLNLMLTCKKFHKEFSSDRVWQRIYSHEFDVEKIFSNKSYKDNFKLHESLSWSKVNIDPSITTTKLKITTQDKDYCAAVTATPLKSEAFSMSFKVFLPTKSALVGIGIADTSTDAILYANGAITSCAWSDGMISGFNRGQIFKKFTPFKDQDVIEVILDQPKSTVEWKHNGKSLYLWKDTKLKTTPLHFVGVVKNGSAIEICPPKEDKKM